MIFVAYSHKDTQWLTALEEMAAPLKKYGGLRPESDKDIKAGEDWRKRIDALLQNAVAAVLLVSRHFLNSDFIMKVELPTILKAQKERGLKVLWVLVSHCLWEETPVETLQAALSPSIALKDMPESKCDAELKKLCGTIKDAFEQPALNTALNGLRITRKMENLKLLLRPCTRRAEVFVRADNTGDWYHQGCIEAGQQRCTCYFGNDKTPPNTGFHIICMTTESKVPHQGGKPTRPLPSYRKLSNEVRVIRKS
jgi:hypothetical protein